MITRQESATFELSRSKLLDLFLGNGKQKIKLDDQKLTITNFFDQRLTCSTDVVQTYSVNASGTSTKRSVRIVSGSGTISSYDGNKNFKCSLVLHIEEIH